MQHPTLSHHHSPQSPHRSKMGLVGRLIGACRSCFRVSVKNVSECDADPWAFRRPTKGYEHVDRDPAWLLSSFRDERAEEQSKRAIAVAGATAAAADAAVAAAKAAVAVVRLTSHGNAAVSVAGGVESFAALRIQSAFRCHLAKKALRALKALVKLQALVRGYLVRKRTALAFQSMRALMRAQATMHSMRSPHHSSKSMRQRHSRRTYERNAHPIVLEPYENDSPKVIKIDDFPSLYISKPRHLQGHDEPRKSTTAHNTPRYVSSVCSTSTGGGSRHSTTDVHSCPNYMANTQSFSAKLRSQSAPRQRLGSPTRLRKRGGYADEVVESRASLSALGSFRSVVVGRVDRSLDLLTGGVGSRDYYQL